MKGTFILAGCSVSSGVPAIGNDWGACDPAEPKNRRGRPCALVRTERTTLVIDTGPDFREQLNRLDIAKCDAVVYSHAHSDHVGGIDELRIMRFRQESLMDIYANHETMDILHRRFDYMFADKGTYKKTLRPHIIEDAQLHKPMKIGDIPFTPFHQDHGDCSSLGFRFGNLGYSVDMLDIGEEGLKTLQGVDVWLVDGAGHYIEDHKTHAPLSRIYKLNEKVGAKKVYVLGLSKFMDFKALQDELPEGFEPSYDGLTLGINFS